jgi:hypothetical protein
MQWRSQIKIEDGVEERVKAGEVDLFKLVLIQEFQEVCQHPRVWQKTSSEGNSTGVQNS